MIGRDYYIGSPDIYSSITDDVWHIIMLYEGYPFQTYRGYKFSYRIKGNEIFVNRKDTSKSIIRSSVDIAVKEALELRAQGVKDYGPKKLKVFGASYIWGSFHTTISNRNAPTKPGCPVCAGNQRVGKTAELVAKAAEHEARLK